LDLGGSRGRPEATGRGCMIVIEQALRRFNMEPADTRVVIQGFGNVGGMAAKLMARAGLSEACIISYIQYIGVVSTGLPSDTSGGAPPNSPIAI